MIFVRDKGRMCNNILQYGHLYAWGREHGRKTMSMRFAYKYQYFHICDTPHHNFLTYVCAKYAAKWGLIPTVSFHEKDADTTTQEQQMLRHRFLVAEGWEARWYDLFLKYKKEILALFAFRERVTQPVNQQLASLPKADLRLGVHIRRGDYRTWNGGRFFYTDEQYLRPISQFISQHPSQRVQVFICGNDPSLDKEFFTHCIATLSKRERLPSAEVYFPEGNPGQDLYLLSRCDYLMGAPSTFSLVASMYHDTPLYWIMDAEAPLTEASFGTFDELFRHIL